MKTILGRIWLFWAVFWFISLFLLLYPLLYLLLLSPKTYKWAHEIRKVWGTVTAFMSFIVPIVYYEKALPKNQQVIFCPNHISYLDIITCGSFLPGFNFFMGKIELAKIPLFGIWFKSLDIAVHRESLRGSHKAFLDASKQMDDLGANLVIYPEGRIPEDAPHLKFPFKPGAFRLAIEKQVPIVPVTLADNINRFNSDTFTGSPGKMRMYVHAPIETKGLSMDDLPGLQEKVYNVIYSQLKSLQII